MTPLGITAVIIAVAAAAGLIVMQVQDRRGRAAQRAKEKASHPAALHQADAVHDAAEAHELRDDRLDAVVAQCLVTPEYAVQRLAEYEADVSDLLELALELDDQSPRPAAPHEE